MRNKLNTLFFLIVCLFAQMFAADNYNQTVTLIAEGSKFKLLRVDAFAMTDQEGNYYSEPINLGGWNTVDGYIQIQHTNETGTEDIDVTLQYSYTKSNFGTWTDGGSDGDLEQLTGGTTLNDTLGIADTVDQIVFHDSLWMRVKVDGQASNPATTVTIYVWLNKS